MKTEKEQPTTIRKEMGITHRDFYEELPNLLAGIPYQQTGETVTFQIDGKDIALMLDPEGSRQLGHSIRLPVTVVTLRFVDCSEEQIDTFIEYFNLRFMKGGG